MSTLTLTQLLASPLATLDSALTSASNTLVNPRSQRAFVRLLTLAAIGFAALVLAVGGYASFWWAYVPERGLRKEVWLQYGEGRPPFAMVDLPPGEFIASDQSYDVTLDLTVPVSEKNMDLGNFMVRLTLLTPLPFNVTLHHVSRPFSLSYHSPLTRSILTLTHFPSLFSYSSRQVQHLSVPLMRREVVQTSGKGRKGRVGGAVVEVGRRDAYAEGGFAVAKGWGELQVYEASLRFDAHFEGLRYLMYHHPVISFLTFTSLFLFFELTTALSTWALISYRRSLTDPLPSSPTSHSTGRTTSLPSSTSEEDDVLRRRRNARMKIEEADRMAEAEAAARQREAERVASRRRGMEAFDEEDEEEEETTPLTSNGKREEDAQERFQVLSEQEGSPSSWQALSPVLEQRKLEDEGEDEGTVGGSETTASGSGRGRGLGSLGSEFGGTTVTGASSKEED